MKSYQHTILASAIAVGVSMLATGASAETFTDAVSTGKVSGAFRLRYEGVQQDNALKDAKGMTLRSAIKYSTGNFSGFSAVIEAEDVRIVGVHDYSVPVTGYKTGEYSVIGDPETTEINQGYLQYSSGAFTAKLGRQDLRYDNQRFIGAVPWRQDWQSFDAFTAQYKTDQYTLDYNYITQRNRIFAEAADIESKDNLLHASVKTPAGLLVGYAYLLEEDIPTSNSMDTYGARLSGGRKAGDYSLSYTAEYATQSFDRGPVSADADYYLLEGGITVRKITAKLGFESMGSDGGSYGFATPLATLHAFDGWADNFLGTPAQGINDVYLSLAGKVGGGTATAVYHDFRADVSTPGVDDLGSEFDVQWVKPFKGKYTFGIKYADYSQGDIAAKPDKRIFWSWVQLSF